MHTLEQVRSGELAGITRLKISQQLTAFPSEILTLADSLEILDLTDNQLSQLPDDFAKLTKLRIVFMSNNCFTELPKVLGACPNLEMIGFKSNQITTMDETALPEKLRWLILTDNKITQLPNSLGLRPRLQKLALAGNQLTELPATMAQLHNLELIRLSANRLQAFPTQLLDLPKLAWLAFSGNDFNRHQQVDNDLPQVSPTDYQLQHVLGQGASGVISLATWRNNAHQLADDIAVKVFKGEVTSDGYPQDELNACLKTGRHPNLVQSLAHVTDPKHLALVMALIPAHFKNLGLPPTFATCTRDTFPDDFELTIEQIDSMVAQMTDVITHMQNQGVSHGDIYAHNVLFDEEANILVGDFGAASIYDDQPKEIQQKMKIIESRALGYFIEDLLSVCRVQDRTSSTYQKLHNQAQNLI
ncbi:leucine-rich repeat-containing protein kinase family protein [Photobacterium lucens]|uniref:leucine-rich repeat-containing protein kinase family protein n=1 Tax=Photobacterium lucens TaxID=2562949 RepID=UPI0013690D1E|nr:leucine-rich repeat-containing protein kinase family protein [Photobacterium lucens]MBP2702003.1 serine/threonine-protein kinase [Vibrio parahaemolyticus]MZG58528.1 protein kinase [Photobacterium lucens]MZG82935.1 protein kinase [Photobacterium lucens]